MRGERICKAYSFETNAWGASDNATPPSEELNDYITI